MTDSFEASNNRFVVVQNDKVAFDTDHASIVQLPPETHLNLFGQTITFPSFVQRKAYARWQTMGGASACELWSTLLWQEWGPDEATVTEWYQPGTSLHVPGPTTRNLPRTLLGTVPPETNYLDVRVRLTRTTTPPAAFGLEVPLVLFQEGQWITLPGGSCPAEIFGGIYSRLFNVVRIGNSIYLERYQSVWNTGTDTAPGGYAQNNEIDNNQSGWNSSATWPELGGQFASDGSACGPYSNNQLYDLLDKRGPDVSGNKRPNGGTNACNAGWSDLTSVFTGDIVVIPCIHRA